MNDPVDKEIKILKSATGTFDLQGFLKSTLEYGCKILGCSTSSVYVYDDCTRKPKPAGHWPKEGYMPPELCMAIAEKAFHEKRHYNDPGTTNARHNFRSISVMPVFRMDEPIGAYLFGFSGKLSGEELFSLSSKEKEAIEGLSKQICSDRFGRALQRCLVHQDQIDIRKAGEGPSHLRQEISRFLSRLEKEIALELNQEPDLIYLQLVDRRRNYVRAIQGFGLPLSHHVSVSPPVIGTDIQSVVACTGDFHIIAGFDPDLFNRKIFDRFGHKEFVRLWFPLFPLCYLVPPPLSLENTNRFIQEALEWQETQGDGKSLLRLKAVWRKGKTIPERLIYGTLEVGYRLKNPGSLSLSPFSYRSAQSCASRALWLSDRLYRATLQGSLEAIGQSVARHAKAKETRIVVAMPDWRTPESRAYPLPPSQGVSVPVITDANETPPQGPALVSFEDNNGEPIEKGYSYLMELRNSLQL